MRYPWQYDENVQVGADYLDTEQVHGYDARMQLIRDVTEEAQEIHKALDLIPDSVIWEIGTGTGECALYLARHCREVYATDTSPTMLRHAQHKARQRQIDNVRFEVGGFLSGFRPADPVDAVVSQLVLHHLPDFWKSAALSAIRDTLRPNGRLYLRDVVFPSGVEDYDSFFERVVEDVRARAGDGLAKEVIQHIKTEYSTFDWILEGMMERNGLKIVKKEDRGFLTAYVCERLEPDTTPLR